LTAQWNGGSIEQAIACTKESMMKTWTRRATAACLFLLLGIAFLSAELKTVQLNGIRAADSALMFPAFRVGSTPMQVGLSAVVGGADDGSFFFLGGPAIASSISDMSRQARFSSGPGSE
jgi:hypothetical protein